MKIIFDASYETYATVIEPQRKGTYTNLITRILRQGNAYHFTNSYF